MQYLYQVINRFKIYLLHYFSKYLISGERLDISSTEQQVRKYFPQLLYQTHILNLSWHVRKF